MSKEQGFFRKVEQKFGEGLEVGGIVTGIVGLLTQGKYLVVAGIASFLSGNYIKSEASHA